MLKHCLRNCFFLLLLITNSYCNSQPSGQQWFAVTKVIDGDTFYINDGTGKEGRIRLTGIDAPESRKSQHKSMGHYGKEASDYLHLLLKGKKVRLEYDVSRRDRYGRILAYAYLENGEFLNALLIKQGYALQLTIPPNVKYAALFSQLQREARENRRGLWGKK